MYAPQASADDMSSSGCLDQFSSRRAALAPRQPAKSRIGGANSGKISFESRKILQNPWQIA
jgi:hypothetical protein